MMNLSNVGSSGTRPLSRLAVAVVAAPLLLVACGGDSDEASIREVTVGGPAATADGATDADSDDGFDDGGATPSVHPALVHIPLPPGVEPLFDADVFDASVDPKESVIQSFSVELDADETVRFVLAELPRAGFTILGDGREQAITSDDDVLPGLGGFIYFDDPDGIPGVITVLPQGDRSSININYFRGGDI